MNSTEFNKIFDFIGNDEYLYILVKNLPFQDKSNVYSQIFESAIKLLHPSDYLRVNMYLSEKGIVAFNSVPRKNKSNALLIRCHAIPNFANESQIKMLVEAGYFAIRHRSFLSKQQVRKEARIAEKKIMRETIKNNAKAILKGTNEYIPRKDWMAANQIVLTKKSTDYEKKVYDKLVKALRKRVKRQVPFTINKRVYFADICIKCKRLIIEIDGGYHNRPDMVEKDKQRDEDFASIGYTTLRISNEEVKNRESFGRFISSILKTPNHRKTGTKEQ